MAENTSLTVYPSGYDANDYSADKLDYMTDPVGKGSDNTSSYARIKTIADSSSDTYIYWLFDLSSIPNEATIDSVECKVNANTTTTNDNIIKSATAQLYTGDTPKGSSVNIRRSETTPLEVPAGLWTRDELSNCRMKLFVRRGSTGSGDTYYVRFYGADITVRYSISNEEFMLKLADSWHTASRVFKKTNGIWVEQSDLSSVIPDGVKYTNGGEYIAPVRPASVTITGTGNSTYCYATINGTKHSGAASNIEVMPGDVITFGVYGRSSTYYGRVTIDGAQALNVTNQQTRTYNWTVPDGVKTISISMSYTSASTQRNGRITVTTS